jgi:predicted nucleotidyltransferase
MRPDLMGEEDGPPPSRAEDGSLALEGEDVNEEALLDALADVSSALEEAGVGYALIGGLASSAYGRPRWTHDIDVFVHPDDAGRTLEVLASQGFATQKTDSRWLYKGVRDGVLVDVIFRSTGDVYLDEEMLARSQIREVKGRRVRAVAPEDLILIKAVVHDEWTPRHWFDAQAILARTDLDWEYLVRRARLSAFRVLSLLLFARSNDVAVPDEPIQSLLEMVHLGPDGASGAGSATRGEPA